MGEKFDRMIGNFKVALGEKEYPFSMTLRQRGMYNNLRIKMDQEAIIMFLFERFKEGFVNANKALGKTVNVGELEEYEGTLNQIFLTNFESINTEVMISLGIVTREQIAKAKQSMEDVDFLDSFLRAKLEEETGKK